MRIFPSTLLSLFSALLITVCLAPAASGAEVVGADNGATGEAATAPPASSSEPAAKAPTTGLEIMKKVDWTSRSLTQHQVMRMRLINSRGQERVRTIEGWSKEVSDDEDQRFSRFLTPSDVKDTTLLSYDYDQKDDDTWLYLPALKKIKRILSSNKTDSFMGSDFSYWDLENMDFLNWSFKLLGSDTIDALDTWKVEGTPTNDTEAAESGYSKIIYWVGKQDFVNRKTEFYDTKDRLAKIATASKISLVGDNPPKARAHLVEMSNLISKHKTSLAFEKLEVDVSVADRVFSQRNLRQ